MMKPRPKSGPVLFLARGAAVLCLGVAQAFSQAQDKTADEAPHPPIPGFTPDELASAASHLSVLSGEIDKITLTKFVELASIFRDAAGGGRTAAGLFIDCKRVIDFEWDDKTRGEAAGWVDDNDEWLYCKAHAAALQVQLNYLALTLQAAATTSKLESDRERELSELFPLLMDHIDSVIDMPDPPGSSGFKTPKGRRLSFHESLNGSVFDQRYDLHTVFSKLKENWELDPFDIGGIYESSIMPYLRLNAPDQLVSAWQRRIDGERKIAARKEGKAEFNFNRLKLPSLEWGMHKDAFFANPSPQNAGRMIAHISEHKQTHPDAGDWVQEAIFILKGDSGDTATP